MRMLDFLQLMWFLVSIVGATTKFTQLKSVQVGVRVGEADIRNRQVAYYML